MVHLGMIIGSKFYTVKFNDKIILESGSIFIHFKLVGAFIVTKYYNEPLGGT
jgi:hypothetical protein